MILALFPCPQEPFFVFYHRKWVINAILSRFAPRKAPGGGGLGLSQGSGTRLLILKMNNKAVWTDGQQDAQCSVRCCVPFPHVRVTLTHVTTSFRTSCGHGGRWFGHIQELRATLRTFLRSFQLFLHLISFSSPSLLFVFLIS